MGEYVSYRGREAKIGTCENLYYCSYEKYNAALSSGFLSELPGNAAPRDYVNAAYGFRFRFPFPDEDKLGFGAIIEPFNRGVPILVSAATIDNSAKGPGNVCIEIVQQKPVVSEFEGKKFLALVFRDPATGQSFSIRDDKDIRNVVSDMVRNNIVNEPDPRKKSFYRAIAARILKGYGLRVLPEYKKALEAAENIHSTGDYRKKFRIKRPL